MHLQIWISELAVRFGAHGQLLQRIIVTSAGDDVYKVIHLLEVQGKTN